MDKLTNYVPTNWTEADWTLARPVLIAAAKAGGWATETVAYKVLRSLTIFLAVMWPQADRNRPPDLAAYLTPFKINLFAADLHRNGGAESTAPTIRAHLRRTAAQLQAPTDVPACPPKPLPVPATAQQLQQVVASLSSASADTRRIVRRGLTATVAFGCDRAERKKAPTAVAGGIAFDAREVPVHSEWESVRDALLGEAAGGPLLSDAEERAFAQYLKKQGLTPRQCSLVWLHGVLLSEAAPGQMARSLRSKQTGDDGAAVLATWDIDSLLAMSDVRAHLLGHGSSWLDLYDPGPTVTSPASAAQATKKPSARQVRAMIKAAQVGMVSEPLLSPPAERVLAEYAPKDVDERAWRAVHPMAQRLIRRYGPSGVTGVRPLLTDVALYLLWLHTQNTPMDLNLVCDLNRLEAWAAAQKQLKDVSSRRARLRRVLTKANPQAATAATPTFGRRQAKPAYSKANVEYLHVLVRNQSGRVRRGALFILGLGLGAGFDGRDLKGMTTDHVIDHGEEGIQVISAGSTRRVRTVWVRREYEPLVREAMAGLSPGQRLLGHGSDKNHNVTDEIVAAVSQHGGGARLDPSRCRSTWLASLLAERVPLGVILAASGISTATTLVELALAMPEAPPQVARASQRGQLDDLAAAGQAHVKALWDEVPS